MTAPVNALPVGTTLGWGLVITRVIGAGGFGITYEAMNRVTERRVAIKEFFPLGMAGRDETQRLVYSQAATSTIEWALEKFERTTTELCRLEHPHILKVLDYMPGNNTGYMVMELLEGHTLGDWLLEREPARPAPAEMRAMFEPILDALGYLHERGLIHRDVAPDNIILCRDGRPVLIDFGALSRDVSKQTKVAATVGLAKAHYTAPEQARANAHPDPTTDIYSIGAVFYRALMGEPPEDGSHRASQLALGEGDPYLPLAGSIDAALPAPLARAVDACLALKKAERPQSIDDLTSRLGWDKLPLTSGRVAASHAAPVSARTTVSEGAVRPEPPPPAPPFPAPPPLSPGPPAYLPPSVAPLPGPPPGRPPIAPLGPVGAAAAPQSGTLAVGLLGGAGTPPPPPSAVHAPPSFTGSPADSGRRGGAGALGFAAVAVLIVGGAGLYLATRDPQNRVAPSVVQPAPEIRPLPHADAAPVTPPRVDPGPSNPTPPRPAGPPPVAELRGWRLVDVVDRPDRPTGIFQSAGQGLVFAVRGETVTGLGEIRAIEREGSGWVATFDAGRLGTAAVAPGRPTNPTDTARPQPGVIDWRLIDVVDRANEPRSAILQSTERGIIFVKVGEEVPTRGRVTAIERRGDATGTRWTVTLANGTVLQGR